MAIFAAISPETPLIGYSEHGCQRAGCWGIWWHAPFWLRG